MPVLEAMAAGTPVLTANVSATTEVAAGAALEVDPLDVDAIREGLVALRDGDHAERTARGRQRAADFTWARSADRLLQSFHRAMDS